MKLSVGHICYFTHWCDCDDDEHEDDSKDDYDDGGGVKIQNVYDGK
jgi:hypothetical protein